MNKRIYFNAFHMNCVVHQSPGLWVSPGDKMHQYTDLGTWVELAKLLERGKFDALFLADVIGVYDVYGGNGDAALRQAAQVPVNDPALLIPAMAYATEHLGFAFTSSVLQYHPFIFARLISTLDHLTNGRIAWNIVTTYLESGARSLGQAGLLPHDQRYEMADEYVEACCKLWEASWEDGAVVRDRERRIYVEPSRVHAIHHEGKYFKVDGCHLAEPSLQRTPVLFQAGSSPRGRQFAARHAECVFLTGPRAIAMRNIREMREQAQAQGRNPEDLRFFLYLKVITGATEAAVQRKYEEYLEQVNYEGELALLSGWAGIDFGQFGLDQPLEYIETNAVRSLMQALAGGERKRTLRDLVKGLSGVIAGTPEQVADVFEEWIAAGVDGFNLGYVTTPGTFADFVDGVVPVLQQRGLMQIEYEEGTLREKLFGQGRARLPASHPDAQYRR
ncbi:MAG TPA: LLM class flavin-dependent oxidoreductase [Candidatus Binataceae bacterium]|nr:LLM class flavin-dependent oxidoreductase [Candidatus Binataceae bacterium]